jgi:hypothetical protein
MAQTMFQYYNISALMKKCGLGFVFDEAHPHVLRTMQAQETFLDACMVLFKAEGI